MSNILSKAELDSQVSEKRARISDLEREIYDMQEDFYLRSAGLAIWVKCLVGQIHNLENPSRPVCLVMEECELIEAAGDLGWLTWNNNSWVMYFLSEEGWRLCKYPYPLADGKIKEVLETKRASL